MATASAKHTERRSGKTSVTPAPVYNPPGSSGNEPWYQKKVLGLPVWAILLLVAGLVAYLWYSSQAGNTQVTAPSPGSAGGGGTGGGGGGTGGGGSGGGSGGGVGSGGSTDPYSPGAAGSPNSTPLANNTSTQAPSTHYVVENAAQVTPSSQYTLDFPTQPGGGAVYAPQLRRIIQGGSHAAVSAVNGVAPVTRSQVAVATLSHGGPPGSYNPHTAPQLRPTSGGAAPATVRTREQVAVHTLTHGGPTGTVRPSSGSHRAPSRHQAAATARTVPKPQGTQGHPGVRGATR